MCFKDLWATALAAWPTIWFLDLLRYLLAAGLVAAVLTAGAGGWLEPRRVRVRTLRPGQLRRELAWSMSTVLVFSLVGTAVFAGSVGGVFRMYTAVHDHGWPWLLVSLPVMLVLHDAWFYWTHRWMHRPRVFAWVHRTHHDSVAPTPWTAYSFNPAEAAVQALFLPAVLLLVPVHQAVLFAWMAWMVVRNVMGHGGAELLPRAWLAGWWGRWLTTSLHHELHHAHGHSNYGLYFLWWDRWCGTEHPAYRTQLVALVGRIGESPGRKPAGAEG